MMTKVCNDHPRREVFGDMQLNAEQQYVGQLCKPGHPKFDDISAVL